MITTHKALAAIEEEDPILFFDDVVRISKIKPGTLRHLRFNGQGPPFARSGRVLRIRKSALMKWLETYDQPDQ